MERVRNELYQKKYFEMVWIERVQNEGNVERLIIKYRKGPEFAGQSPKIYKSRKIWGAIAKGGYI